MSSPAWAYRAGAGLELRQALLLRELFRDQQSGLFQLESSSLRDPERIDRLLLVVAIAVLVSSLQRFAVWRHRVDPHLERGLSSLCGSVCSGWQQCVANTGQALLAWLPIPLREQEPCIASPGIQRRQKQP